ncbi:chemotaxis protein CheW [Limnofasciculus baicalensis]|uniref:CheW domain-containing protein n=1 Tax=Limnofasciculus baicalensis BBK-W-15 TaxID=2699891 RepID=A0AAE3KMY8_9CYAN|nr:CheW domain-containing protein [Limnofasciculus baicalensis]MCP2728098.1 CheW domain-containing protein [Limnofasciculus baicalensis BBK-W-15]
MSDTLSLPNRLSPIIDTRALPPSSNASEQFLRLHLIPDTTALLPIQQLIEVLTIPIGQIVPIAHIPSWVMGVYNWRGEILWMVDLGHRIGLPPWHQQKMGISTHTAVVLHIRSDQRTSTNSKSQMLGLVVNRVEDIEWCNSDLIQSPLSVSITPQLAPFLRGYWLKSTGEMLIVIDGKAIMAGMPKA